MGQRRPKTKTRQGPLVTGPDGKKVPMLVIDHQNGQEEVVGFFIAGHNFQHILEKTPSTDIEARLPRRFNSYADTVAFLEKKTKASLTFQVMNRDKNGTPVQWVTTVGKDAYSIMYIGSPRYNSGKIVDVYLVGTPQENPSGIVN